VIGDLNAYAMEDPIVALEGAGYTDLIEAFLGTDAYSYVFAGQAGYLDHALSNPSLTAQVANATVWHINADEPQALDYNDDLQDPGEGLDSINPVYLYSPLPFRSSDHDPILVHLDLASPKPELSITKAVQPAADVPVGGMVTYTLVVANRGDQVARGLSWRISCLRRSTLEHGLPRQAAPLSLTTRSDGSGMWVRRRY